MTLGGSTGDGSSDGWSMEMINGYEEAMRYKVGDIVGMACIGAYKVLGARSLTKACLPDVSVQQR
jgi:hypothetical protein